MYKFGDKVSVGTPESFFAGAPGIVVDSQQGKGGETLYKVKLDYDIYVVASPDMLQKQGE